MADNIGSNSDSEGVHDNYKVTGTSMGGTSGDGRIKEQDRLLPIANVGRIMKQILPPNAKISKEGKETMQECVSEFISFVTGEASDKCHKEKRKTVNGDDICWALSNLGFDDYVEPMRRYLQKYRDMEGDRLAAGIHGTTKATGTGSDAREGEPSIRNQPPGSGYHFMFNATERNNNDASTSRKF